MSDSSDRCHLLGLMASTALIDIAAPIGDLDRVVRDKRASIRLTTYCLRTRRI